MKRAAQLKRITAIVRAALLMPAIGAMGMAASQGALAQDASPKSKESEAVVGEKVVVTAQKREQALEDVPMAVSAFTQEQLQNLGADGFAGYANFVPGLNLQDRGPGQNRFSIRGVSAPVSTSASTVGVYIDEMAISELLNTPDLALFDVNRVEVLRGPQGTLFGEGSMGGTIRTITNRPNLRKFELSGQVGFGNLNLGGNSTDASAVINAPMGDGAAAMRLVAYYRDTDGWVDNIHSSIRKGDINSVQTEGGRLAFRVQPNADLDMQLTGFYQKQTMEGFNQEGVSLPRGQQSHSNAEGREDKVSIGNLVINYKAGAVTLTSATAAIDRKYVEDRDIGDFGFLPSSAAQNTKASTKGWTQELRLASNTSGDWFWVAGLYYKDSEYIENDTINNPVFGAPTTITTKTKQKAVFADATYRLAPTWELAVGARYSKDEQTTDYRSTVRILPGATADTTGVAPRVNLSWSPDDHQLYYLNIAKGYRAGGVNRFYGLGYVAAGLPLEQATYDPDTTINYELGLKNAWDAGRISLSAAIYYIDWKDIQSYKQFTRGFGISNFGDAHAQGVEAELVLRPLKGLTIGLQAMFQKARFDQTVPGSQVVEGGRIYNTPEETYSAIADYEVPISGSSRFFLHGDVLHMGDIWEIDKLRLLAPYTITNFSGGLRWNKWEWGLYVRNAGDKRAELGYSSLPKDLWTNQPRTIGTYVRAIF